MPANFPLHFNMNIIKFAIDNPVKVCVGVILVVLFGTICLTLVPIQLMPNVDRPMVTVTTRWVGRSPEEVELSIIMEQEKRLKTLQGLYEMRSVASLGMAQITLEFNVGFNMSRAVQEASNRLNEVPSYPEDVDKPVIRLSSAETDEPVVMFEMYTTANDPHFDISEFYNYADRYIKPALENIKGVSEVTIHGGREQEVQIRFNPETLARAGITIDQMQAALRSDNVNESAGDVSSGRLDVRMRVLGRFNDLEPIRQTVIKYEDGIPIRVQDVAEVYLTVKKRTAFSQFRGQPCMGLQVLRESDANVLEVTRAVKKRMDELQAEGGLMRMYKNDRYKIRASMFYDDGTYIEQAIALVRDNMFTGGILAMLVLLFFLRSVRPTLIISLAIPISIFGTFIVIKMTGKTINVISLAGLTFAIGMVIDNSIVVLENIDRHLNMGKTPRQAAYDGTTEVWGAILSSTLTTVAVFAPVLTIQEESGMIFADIAIAISGAIILSLFVSIFVIPPCCAVILKPTSARKNPVVKAAKSLFGLAPLGAWVTNKFSSLTYALMERSLASAWTRIVLVAGLTLASLWASVSLMPPASYLPLGNKNMINGMMNTPPGYSLSQNYIIGRSIMEKIRPFWEAEDYDQTDKILKEKPIYDFKTGEQIKRVPPVKDFFMVVSPTNSFLMMTSKDQDHPADLIPLLNDAMNDIPAAFGSASQRPVFGRGMGSNQISIEVIGPNMDRLRYSAANLQKKLEEKYTKAGVRTMPNNYVLSGPELQLKINQIRAKELGISSQTLANIGRAMVEGLMCGDFDNEGDNIDVTLIRDPDLPLDPDSIGAIPIYIKDSDGQGKVLPFSQITDFVPAEASQQIRRLAQERNVTLRVFPPQEVALEQALADIDQIVKQCRTEGGIAPDVIIRPSGSADKLSQTREAMVGKWTGFNWESFFSILTGRFALSLLITYLLMAALFENWVYPFVILFSVPLALAGGFMGLAWMHWRIPTQQMDTLSMLGFVILIGVVVNNAILIVHQALNFMRGRGESEDDVIEKMPPRKAIAESVRTRIRPIFMTSCTSVFGMLPLVLSPGSGSELYCGLGAVVLGGLAISSIFTLTVVPLLMSLVIDFMSLFQKKSDASAEEASSEVEPV